MADQKISQLTPITPVVGTQLIPISTVGFLNGSITPTGILAYGTDPVTGTTITATTGFTSSAWFRGARGDGTAPTFSSPGDATTGLDMYGSGYVVGYSSGVASNVFNAANFRLKSSVILGFSSGDPLIAATDVALTRISAGVIGVGTGAAGSFAGRLKLTSTIVAATTVAALNASPTVGEISTVNDALAVTAKGATVAAGGSAISVLVWNGSNWVGI